jgi:hypothetical protein
MPKEAKGSRTAAAVLARRRMTKTPLVIETLVSEAKTFAVRESTHDEPKLYGVTDGKAVGTYLEQKFSLHIAKKYDFPIGNSAFGIDFPSIDVDIKVTSVKQPQSSSPFKSARQKIYGLGYHLLVFVYEKTDHARRKVSRLNIKHAIFVDKSRTADFQMTTGVQKILENDGNIDDLIAFFEDKNLPGDDITWKALAEEALKDPPQQGYLTISNALQWRLQYNRAIQSAGAIDGVVKVH